MSNAEIARLAGVEPKLVSALLGARSRKRVPRPSEAGLRTVAIPADVLDAMKPAANARNISVNELVRRLVETVVDDGLIDGLLDDAG